MSNLNGFSFLSLFPLIVHGLVKSVCAFLYNSFSPVLVEKLHNKYELSFCIYCVHFYLWLLASIIKPAQHIACYTDVHL